jgi:hypothetical protein
MHWRNWVVGKPAEGHTFYAERIGYFLNRPILIERIGSDETQRVPLAIATLRAIRAADCWRPGRDDETDLLSW